MILHLHIFARFINMIPTYRALNGFHSLYLVKVHPMVVKLLVTLMLGGHPEGPASRFVHTPIHSLLVIANFTIIQAHVHCFCLPLFGERFCAAP